MIFTIHFGFLPIFLETSLCCVNSIWMNFVRYEISPFLCVYGIGNVYINIYIYMTFSVSIRYRLFEPAPKSSLVVNDRECSNHFVNLSRLNSFSSVFRLKRSDFWLAHWCWGSKRSTFKHLGSRMTRWNNMTADKQQWVGFFQREDQTKTRE